MLILAGVSLNAIIGDNGIITRAQEANIKSGMAALQEYLQLKYTENFEEMSQYKSKIEGLVNEFSGYFYIPSNDGFGSVNYVTDAEGHALYLIEKSGLPSEIKDGLVGGNCGQGKNGVDKYIDYTELNDVYGVTSNLRVYYFDGNGELYGVASSNEFDNDTTSRVVLDSSNPLAGVLKDDGSDVTVADIQSVKNLTIDNSKGITSLKDLYVLTSLESLTLRNLTLDNIDGINTALHLNYVFIDGCVIKNYNSLSGVKKLKYLYLYNVDDTELSNLCEGIKDANYPNLQYMAIVGNTAWLNSTDGRYNTTRTASKYITTLEPLGKLQSSCIGNVEYLSLGSNEITDTKGENGIIKKYALENISQFTKLYLLRLDNNKITSLKGLENMPNLTYLWACYNKLGENEIYNEGGSSEAEKGKNTDNSLCALSGKENLIFLNLEGNLDLKWVSYLASCTNLNHLYFGDGSDVVHHCVNMVDSEVAKLKEVFGRCGTNKSYPGKYWLSLLDENDMNLNVNLKNETISKSQFEMLGNYKNIKYLNLENVSILNSGNTLISSKDEINTLANDVFKKIKNLQYLDVNTISGKSFCNWNSLKFLKGVDESSSNDDINLIEISAYGTKLSTKEEKTTGNWENYDDGLKMLVTKREGLDTYYCNSLAVLYLNEGHINLGDINDCAVRMFAQSRATSFGDVYTGLYIDNKTGMESVSNCVGLTNFYIWALNDATWVIDLSGQDKLTLYRHGTHVPAHSKIIFPSTIKDIIGPFGSRAQVDLSGLKSFNIDFCWSDINAFLKILSSVDESAIIDRLELQNMSFGHIKDFSIFKSIYETSKHKLNVNKFYFNRTNLSECPATSLAGIEYLNNVNTIKIYDGACGKISDISALASYSATMQYIDIPNNSISDIHILSNFSKLTYLNLENNSLVPYVEFAGSDGAMNKWFTISEICTRMRSNANTVGNKVTLKLKNNPAITLNDWNAYTSDMSQFDSNSTYGNN